MIGDPYLFYPQPLRKELEHFYLSKVSSRINMPGAEFREALILCGIQRHMQALGAYGFLSAIRGKMNFCNTSRPPCNC